MQNVLLIYIFLCCVVYVNGTNTDQRTVESDVMLMSIDELHNIDYHLGSQYNKLYEKYIDRTLEEQCIDDRLSYFEILSLVITKLIAEPNRLSLYDLLVCNVANCSRGEMCSEGKLENEIERLKVLSELNLQSLKCELRNMIDIVPNCSFGFDNYWIALGVTYTVKYLFPEVFTLDKFWREKALKYGVD